MTGWRNPSHFDDTGNPLYNTTASANSYWLPEPLSIVTVPQPRVRADPRAMPPGDAGRPNPPHPESHRPRLVGGRRGRLATSAAAVPGTATRDPDWRWLIPTAIFLAVCAAVTWWSNRR